MVLPCFPHDITIISWPPIASTSSMLLHQLQRLSEQGGQPLALRQAQRLRHSDRLENNGKTGEDVYDTSGKCCQKLGNAVEDLEKWKKGGDLWAKCRNMRKDCGLTSLQLWVFLSQCQAILRKTNTKDPVFWCNMVESPIFTKKRMAILWWNAQCSEKPRRYVCGIPIFDICSCIFSDSWCKYHGCVWKITSPSWELHHQGRPSTPRSRV